MPSRTVPRSLAKPKTSRPRFSAVGLDRYVPIEPKKRADDARARVAAKMNSTKPIVESLPTHRSNAARARADVNSISTKPSVAPVVAKPAQKPTVLRSETTFKQAYAREAAVERKKKWLLEKIAFVRDIRARDDALQEDLRFYCKKAVSADNLRTTKVPAASIDNPRVRPREASTVVSWNLLNQLTRILILQ